MALQTKYLIHLLCHIYSVPLGQPSLYSTLKQYIDTNMHTT